MYYPVMMITLCFCFDQPVVSSDMILPNRVLSENEMTLNILEEFFKDLKETYLPILKPRHVTIVGVDPDEIHGVQSVMKSHPYIVCKKPDECDYTKRFSRGSFVIIFLEDLTKPAFEQNLQVISRCKKCRVLFVSKGIVSAEEIRHLFKWSLQRNVAYAEYAHLTNKSVELYSEIIGTNCTMEIQLTDVWSPGVRLDNIASWAFRLHDFNSCPVTVSSLPFRPKMMIKEDENCSLKIAGGREGEMLLTIARKLNFTLDLKYPPLADRMKFSRKIAIVNDVVSGIGEIGMGRLRATNSLISADLTVSIPYDMECVTWVVPRLLTWPNDIFFVEFTWQVWVCVYILFVIICLIGYGHQRFVLSKNNGKRDSRVGFVPIIFDVLSFHLGNPVAHIYFSSGGRLMLMICLSYATVLSTAYKTSLASILATDVGVSKISKPEDIIGGNFIIGGSLYDYNILKDQRNDSDIIVKLMEGFVVINDDNQSWLRLKNTRDFVFIGRRSWMNFQTQESMKAREANSFHALEGCVLNYHAVIVFGKSSLLRHPVNKIIRQLSEAGILDYWDLAVVNANMISKYKVSDQRLEKQMYTYKFRYIFNMYVLFISFSFAIFLTEIFTAWIVSRTQLS